ncbi:hypothetical protein WH52_08490 [Tenacibaculum holothuriorum]|uniref:Uncharacterized protein n=1 Tax=Tenacibaculum holothuriorum TaxID=1635173 RepID=A0A1Y2PC48_9FLAO|nr:hypothetical protein [Tenacibaculum holothuriorum]OSY88056.1 hypothetical protein WH52_08490 [Tenacibaculum holothuriorum]
MRKEFEIKDLNDNSLVTFYYKGNDSEKIPRIKRYIYNLTNFTLQIIAMNYENEDVDDIYGYAELLDEELGFIFHQQTINAISDFYGFSQLARDKINLLRETIRPMINNTLENKMKKNDSDWIKVSRMAQEILKDLGKQQITPSEFEKRENLSMDWI